MLFSDVFSAAVLLLLVIDPFGNVPIVISALANVPAARRTRVVLRECFAAYVVLVCLAFLAVVATTAVAVVPNASPSGTWWAVSTPRAFSPLLTIPGTFALIGIALFGLIRYRLQYNAYIAAGAIVLAVGTGLARFDIPSLIYGAEFAGIAIMFVGFLKAVEWAKEHRKASPGGAPPAAATSESEETTETPATSPK